MIGFEVSNELYTFVRNRVKAIYSSVTFADAYQGQETFPICTFSMREDAINTSRIDSGNIENAVNVMVEVNVYSNKISGKKAEATEIMGAVDESMRIKGFTRIMCQPIENQADATIYRMVARFTATIDAKHNTFIRR